MIEKDTFEEDVELLGKIASNWRAACEAAKHKESIILSVLMEDYKKTVNRLIKSDKWKDCPPPENQLPDDMMPQAFFDYWALERKKIHDEAMKAKVEKDMTDSMIELLDGIILYIMLIVSAVYIMFVCGVCWDVGSRLFLK